MIPKQSRWVRLNKLVCCLITGTLLLFCNMTLPRAQDKDDSFQGYMAREPQRQASQAVVQRFIDAAIARDLDTLKRLVGGPIARRAGPESVEHYLHDVVVPFFANHNAVGRSTTISTAIDEAGNTGFAFYMYSMQKGGEKKPFVVYVLDGNGEGRVANILVDYFVEDRHRPNEQGNGQ